MTNAQSPASEQSALRYTAATAFAAEGVRAGLVSCLTCGAALLLDHRDTTDVLRLHEEWHDADAPDHEHEWVGERNVKDAPNATIQRRCAICDAPSAPAGES